MTKCTAARSSWDRFQLTSSRRGWQSKQPTVSVAWTFQLTSSRRGWHFSDIRILCKNTISTHILTKRMTFFLSYLFPRSTLFQLTSSRRGWQESVFNISVSPCISTHILTKRMTIYQTSLYLFSLYFNSHPHEEDDKCLFFNFYTLFYFNSHPHEEDDVCGVLIGTRGKDISTHILTKRMTSLSTWWSYLWFISTHILTKRMTLWCTHRNKGEGYFNSHPHEEDDKWKKSKTSLRLYFNSHPHEEDDCFIRF